jgi:hypothetical protein
MAMQYHLWLIGRLTLVFLSWCPAVGDAADLSQADRTVPLQVWTFETDPVGSLPSGFSVGTLVDGRPAGEWKVIEAPEAPSPSNVLAQQMNRGSEHAYKMVLIDGAMAANLDLEVSFRAISGKADMGGGLIWRAQDDRNYYLTRANPLEQNIRLYRVVKGIRHQLANFNQIIHMNKWHRLSVVSRGDHFQVFYDGTPVLDVRDKTFTDGRVGLWTKSDAVTYFDDLRLLIVN